MIHILKTLWANLMLLLLNIHVITGDLSMRNT